MNELAIELSADSGKCFYQQIYEYIRNEIRTGKLSKDERLPSTRSLAEYLQVARSTVESAYGQLLAEGYIQARPCRGYFVCGMDELFELAEAVPLREEERDRVKAYFRESESADGTEVEYDFSPHAICMKHFPFSTWKRITREILVDANSEMFALGQAQGDYELRSTICRYLHLARGVSCEPERIIVGAGNDYLLMLLEKILGRHVPIAMESPTYKRAYCVFQSFAYEIKAVPMDQNGINVAELERSGAKAAYVMPSHQFPTGIVMPIGRRMELLKWAQKQEGRYLIEDDYDSEFRYKGKPIPALQAQDHSGKVIYMGTFSKSIAPAIRVSYMVLPLPLMEKYRENCGFYASTVSRIDQRILNEFIKSGSFERYLNKMRKIYREKHDFLLEQLRGMERDFVVSGENAGLHVLLKSKRGITEQALIGAALREKIRIYGLSDALAGDVPGSERYEGMILLGYGALSKEEIRRGVERLKGAWKRLTE